uniref:Integrase catalytic domain-containing protein n=2 Tax=Photinus pyralis TaxID=7054 RepID=A0A1Y1L369_PHOPY
MQVNYKDVLFNSPFILLFVQFIYRMIVHIAITYSTYFDDNVINSIQFPTTHFLIALHKTYDNNLLLLLLNCLLANCCNATILGRIYAKLNSCLMNIKQHGLIATLETTDLNYEIAWNILLKRYNNKRRIINNHVQNILNIQVASRESASCLRDIINTIQMHVNCLASLDQATDQWDALLVPIILNKLDSQTIKEWETKLNNEGDNESVPTFSDLLEFLINKQNILETIAIKKSSESTRCQSIGSQSQVNSRNTTRSFATVESKCLICDANHSVLNCEKFLKLDIPARNKRIRELKSCINCFRKGHFVSNCKSTATCKKCNRKHHTLLHLETSNKIVSSNHSGTLVEEPQEEVTIVNTCVLPKGTETLLSTALVYIKDALGNFHKIRALLDSASQSCFITDDVCKKLKLKETAVNISVVGMGKGSLNVTNKVTVSFKSCHNNFGGTLQCLIVDKITSALPTCSFDANAISIPANIRIADPEFNKSQGVDMLIGASIFWSLVCVGQIQQNGLTYQKTKLGWVISGEIKDESFDEGNINISCLSLNSLSKSVERFWQTDEFCSAEKVLTAEQQYCEDYFNQTTKRDSSGRYIVKIPFKPTLNKLGDSYDTALNRFYALERRLNNNLELKLSYSNFLKEYITLNHMTKIEKDNQVAFYMPHHCVLRETSETTRLRVVFDGSCKLTNGLSINDVQWVGPKLQNEVFSIIARFRLYSYVLTGDIIKMYRQIQIHPEHRKYQRILWRENESDELSVYQLNTVTYGTASAPYLAIRCLIQTALDNEKEFGLEAQIIKEDFYVDDLITGSDNLQTLITIKRNIQQILFTAGFSLQKFKSNVKELRDDTDNKSLKLSDNQNKALGVGWNPKQDSFFYCFNFSEIPGQITKRTILATTAQMYDPLGLLAPIIITAKLMVQELWQIKLTWDESVPAYLHTKWLTFKTKLHYINEIIIPRQVLISDYKVVELHAFSDASQRAFGACLYLRSIDGYGRVKVALLAAKSRVAPLKNVTLPRLELSAAVLAAQLTDKFKNILRIDINKQYYWCDSMIVLAWLKNNPNKWQTYVANRVAEIQRFSNPENWYYVKSSDNAADLISRGMPPEQFVNIELWWKGPNWLSELEVPIMSVDNLVEYLPEQRKVKIQLFQTSTQENTFPFKNFSSLTRLKRVISYCMRFKKNCLAAKMKSEKSHGPLTVSELDGSLKRIILLIQQIAFKDDLKNLRVGKMVNKRSNLLSLTPFVDGEGLIRVGGRLTLSKFNFDKKHPIILPKSNHVTELLFKHQHEVMFHAGPNLVVAAIRERFWPVAAKNTAKKIIKNCVRCTRFNAKNMEQVMGYLPVQRTLAMYPFHSVGVDYAGPYFIKGKGSRGIIQNKAYICLFVCLSTKALHIELVTDLSTKSFLATLKRFVSRRGKPQNIFSDNGTTFIGANNELKELGNFLKTWSVEIEESLAMYNVKWHFIPPRSPNFGGLWEAGVKRVKFHLKRILKNTPLTYEEFTTILVQIESLLNSRPLTPLSSDPNDLEVLTPAHFLIGRSFLTIPEPDVSDIPENRLTRYQLLQKLHIQFWKKWSREYINQLQNKTKWKDGTYPIQIGTMVLLKEEQLPPADWRLARVTQVHPGPDGVVRVVTVKSKSGDFKRSVRKVCVLPIENQVTTTNEDRLSSEN